MPYQTHLDKRIDRAEHVWKLDKATGWFKCCLCGAIVETPPDYPTAKDWMPMKYLALTEDDKAAVPLGKG